MTTTDTKIRPGDRVRLLSRFRYCGTGIVVRCMPSRYHADRTAILVSCARCGVEHWLNDLQAVKVGLTDLTQDETAVALARAVLSGDSVAAMALADRVRELLE